MNVATDLYVGCMVGFVRSGTSDIEPSKPAIFEYVEVIDQECVKWTEVWMPALLKVNITDRPDWMMRFSLNRRSVQAQVRKELLEQAMLK